MYKIFKVENKEDIRKFILFPIDLYKGNEYFVPLFYDDEEKIFDSGFLYNRTCETVFFLCLDDDKVVGRIQGLIQKDYNKKTGEHQARFTRFDSIDDKEVSKLLFKSVESWAKEKGMDTLVGPLSYNDVEREGLLIYGFDERQTYQEQYNYPYYQKLIEDYGFTKATDWFESELKYNKEMDEKVDKLYKRVMEREKLHVIKPKLFESKTHFINRNKGEAFKLINAGYEKLYGTIPYSDEMIDLILKSAAPLLKKDYIFCVENEDKKMICFGFGFPAIGKALIGTDGYPNLKLILKLLKVLRKPEGFDLGLIAIDEEYQNRGAAVLAIKYVYQMFNKYKPKFFETNLNLEDNTKIRGFWKYFDTREHKKRRAFSKTIN